LTLEAARGRGLPFAGMARAMNQTAWIALLERHGWTKRTGGKHQVKMTKGGERPVTLPMHKGRDYAPGLTAAIRRQAGLNGRATGR
jgi:predicted RNA binding protein YcfA (HicA-like mRNA interferase family)